MSALPEAAYAGALAALPGIGPAGLRRLLGGRPPSTAWADVVAGHALGGGRAAPSWPEAARRCDPAALWSAWQASGTSVTFLGAADYPVRLRSDPEPPAVLFVRGGGLPVPSVPSVAVVGTRRPTPEGRSCAYHLARDLAGAGAWVVSGLALGIDGAAHQGALDAGGAGRTVGVAAGGVDRPYPPQHRALYERVAATGAVVSECPPGQPAQAWRFPSRNRVIAGAADLVVVVESFATGGSMLTVDAALSRGVEVRVVPGSVTSPASAGTNQLLYDGAPPVRDAGDVLDALGRFGLARRAGSRPAAPVGGRAHRPSSPGDASVLEAVSFSATSPGRVVERCGRPLAEVADALHRLEGEGWLAEEGGWWRRLR